MINLELFSCAGGMAEGFRRAGVTFDMAVDFAEDHCDSYEANLGHRPVRMDVRDLLRMVKLGWRVEIDLLVADPPCTPWSRAGKREGTADERDMLVDTCELIGLLRPRRYLIGNVPGLDDSTNLPIVQRAIGGLSRFGYCTADFARLDAADYGVPQHRIRPFWFGHSEGPCIRWPQPTHCDPDRLMTAALPGIEALAPWRTCRDALHHLTGDDLGRPVRMRKRSQNGHQHGSVADRPALGVGTSNLSDGNVIVTDRKHPSSYLDEPAMTVVGSDGGGAKRTLRLASRGADPHERTERAGPSDHDPVSSARPRDDHATTLVLNEPSTKGPQWSRTNKADRLAATVLTDTSRVSGNGPKLEWPWDQPSSSILRDARIPPPGHHDEFSILSHPDAVLLSERAAAILQGFPESWVFAGATKKARWSQLGQAMPPALAGAVARSVVEQDKATR